jgi:phenylpropionate dioxygenase-like ring-hydroxylating dioxygenase large terminal subunit
MDSLAHHWHAVARSSDVGRQPCALNLLGVPLVAFRDEDGPAVFKDLCIHRGTALSLGFVEEGLLHCGYHGWAYDRSGVCKLIPSLAPGSAIPSKARAIAYQAIDRYGLLWVALDDPVAPLPGFPGGEDTDPNYRTFLSHEYEWATSAGRAVENFMDPSHFAFVHEGVLGSRDNTETPPHTVLETEWGVHYRLVNQEPATLHSAEGEEVTWEYYLYPPFTIHLSKTTTSDQRRTLISMTASPIEAKRTKLFLWISRNYDLDPALDQGFVEFTHGIMEQDRRIVESQRPEEIPVDLREEMHLKVPDASGIAYRKLLGRFQDATPFLP